MEKVLKFFEISHSGVIFSEWLIACIYLLALIFGIVVLYKNNFRNKELKNLVQKVLSQGQEL